MDISDIMIHVHPVLSAGQRAKIDAGDGQAGFCSGNLYAEPAPRMQLRPAGRLLHWSKVAYEKYWFYKWF